MHLSLTTISAYLIDLEKSILASMGDDRTFAEMWGWNHPVITRKDLAMMAGTLGRQIKETGIEKISAEFKAQVDEIPPRISSFKSTVLPQLKGGQGFNVTNSLISLL